VVVIWQLCINFTCILVSSLNDTKRIFSSVKQQAQREERIKKAKQEAGQ